MDLDKFLADVRASRLQQRFFHFTDKQNVRSIREHGLLSTAELKRRNLFKAVKAGGDAVSQRSDHQKGTDEFVCLCFTDSHPMCHVAQQDDRKLDPIYLQINPEIIKGPGVMVTNAPSNQNGVDRVAAAQALDNLDLEILYNWMDWKDPTIYARRKVAEKYEILVPRHVAVPYIVHGLRD